MASKNISLREAVYERLRAAKREDESFSDVIDRLLDPSDDPLGPIVGAAEEERADALREGAAAAAADLDAAAEEAGAALKRPSEGGDTE